MIEQNEQSINDKLSSPQTLACREGLVGEDAACYNLDSYLCQFIAPSFAFKIVPVREIVAEARLTESEAEKCRPVIDLLSRNSPGE